MSCKIQLLGGINCKSLYEHTHMNILARIFPQEWIIKYFKPNAGQLRGLTLDNFVKFFDTLDHASASVWGLKPEGKRSRNSQDDGKSKRQKTEDKKSFVKKKFCQSYTDAGCPEWLHLDNNTKDYKKRAIIRTRIMAMTSILTLDARSIKRKCVKKPKRKG